MDWLLGFIGRPSFVLLGGRLVMGLVRRPWIFPGGLLLRAGLGFALDLTGNGAVCRGFARIQGMVLVFLDSWLVSLSRIGRGAHRIGRRPGLEVRAGFLLGRGRPFWRRGGPRLAAQPHRERDGGQQEQRARHREPVPDVRVR